MPMTNLLAGHASAALASVIWSFPVVFLALYRVLDLRTSPLCLFRPFVLAVVMLTAAKVVYTDPGAFATYGLPLLATAVTLVMAAPRRTRVI